MNCDRKTIFGRPACRFEARYDESSKPVTSNDRFNDVSVTAVFFGREVPTEHKKTYVRDVCTTCGKTIERQP